MNYFHHPNIPLMTKHHQDYLKLVPAEIPLLSFVDEQGLLLSRICRDIYDKKGNYSYEKGKWSLNAVIGHLIDWDRIMLFRIMSIARNLEVPLPSLDPDKVMDTARCNERSLDDLLNDWDCSNSSTIKFLSSLNLQDLSRKGTVATHQISANDLAYVNAGHVAHHIKILKERYL